MIVTILNISSIKKELKNKYSLFKELKLEIEIPIQFKTYINEIYIDKLNINVVDKKIKLIQREVYFIIHLAQIRSLKKEMRRLDKVK